MIARRSANPPLSESETAALTAYLTELEHNQDMRPTSVRNYISDLRLYLAWYETDAFSERRVFAPDAVTTAILARYRTYLQTERQLKPTSINRSLVTLKKYFGWVHASGHSAADPARALKLVGQETTAPRHIIQDEEDALIAAVTTHGSVRDRTLIIMLLHTGLRAGEVCHLKRAQVSLVARATTIHVLEKGNKYGSIPRHNIPALGHL